MFRTEAELKEAYAERLRNGGQGVSVDVPTNSSGGTIDILTEREIIFCTLALNGKSAIALQSQLNFYGKFVPGRTKIALTYDVIDNEAANQLNAANISLVIASQLNLLPIRLSAKTKAKRQQATPQEQPSQALTAQKSLYRYPALDSVKGGDGLRIAIISCIVVLLIGLVGLLLFS